LLLNLATALILGADAYRDYVNTVLPSLRAFQGFGYNLSIAGLWHKVFDPTAEVRLAYPIWQNASVARWGTVTIDLLVTAVVADLARRARTPAQRDLAIVSSITAMIMVSPIAWDITLFLLLLPVAVVVRTVGHIRWVPVLVLLITLVIWLPQPLLTTLATAGGRIDIATLAFMLGAASVKFYALVGTFALGLFAYHVEQRQGQPDRYTGVVPS
jgi:hypothetical protein